LLDGAAMRGQDGQHERQLLHSRFLYLAGTRGQGPMGALLSEDQQ